jgi:hypothetical protein
MIYEVILDKDMIAQAKRRDEKAFIKMGNFETKQPGARMVGVYAEEAVGWLLPDLKRPDSEIAGYDFIDKNGVTYDVKATGRTVRRLPDIDLPFKIREIQRGKVVDRYIFCRVYYKTQPIVAWVCGWIDKEDFFTNSKRFAKGDMDDGIIPLEMDDDCYQMGGELLNSIALLLDKEIYI